MTTATSNYARIEQLGIRTAEGLRREDYHRTFSTAQHFWRLIEETLAKAESRPYDILAGWLWPTGQMTVPTVGSAALRLRECLHQWAGRGVAAIAVADARVLQEKGLHYGDSWKRRGGVGAFMMLARKWDRIEVIHDRENAKAVGGISISQLLYDNPGDVMDDIADLRRYLLLCEDEVLALSDAAGEPMPHGYVDQG